MQDCCPASPGFKAFPSCVVFLPLLSLSVDVGAGVGAVAAAALLLLQLYCSPWCITLVETFSCRIVALLSPGFNFFPSCVVFLPLLLLSVGVGAGVGAVAVAALLLLQLYCSLVHNFS